MVVGVNHRTAPVELRERLAFSEAALKESFSKLNNYPVINGCVILSTCNRTEIYAAPSELDEGLNASWDFLSTHSKVSISDIKRCTYTHTLYDTIRHLFRVASGLDSMILGETQILGQVKQAYQLACRYKASNRILNTLFQQAIAIGKRVRTETGIDQNPVSISYAAVELARQHLGCLKGKSILVIGAGKMSALTVKYLVDKEIAGVIVSNRSYQRAVTMARDFGGMAVRFNELYKYLKLADIVISCTSASHYVLRAEEVAETIRLRQNRPLFMIDIAVPRDIEPAVANLKGVTLYDIDDLQNVVDSGLNERKKAAISAERIIEVELDDFMKWLSAQFVVPTIIALKQRGEEVKQKELLKALNRFGKYSEREYKIIASLANSIVNQLLHEPVTLLKKYALTPEGHLYTEVLQNLFNLEVAGQVKKVEAKSQ